MKNTKLFALVPMLLMSTLAHASYSQRNIDESAKKLDRNDFIDYCTDDPDSDTSYTMGVEVHALRPNTSYNIGHNGFVAAGAAPYTKGSSINFNRDFIAGVKGVSYYSSKKTGTILRIEAKHHNKAASPKTVTAKDDSSIFINDIFSEAEDATQYDSVTHSLANKRTHVTLGIAGYSLQHRRASLTTFFGGSGAYMHHDTSVAGTETAVGNDINTQAGSQKSFSGGLWGEVNSSLILYDSEDSAVLLNGSFSHGTEASNNTGSLLKTKTDGGDDTITHSHHTNLDPWTYHTHSEKKLSISYVSKPRDDDQSFFAMEFGVCGSHLKGVDITQKMASGKAGDIDAPSGFLKLTYTM